MASPGRVARTSFTGIAVALLALVGMVGLLTNQVTVTSSPVGAIRACGSALDTIVDRTGWESWLAADLAEPDAALPAELVRTRACPGAVNERIVATTLLGCVGALAAAVVWWSRQRLTKALDRQGADDPIGRLGRLTFAAGLTLTAGGLVALIFLIADADSTLFLYTDRLVVGLMGLIVLVPPMALVAIGRVLMLLGDRLEPIAEVTPPGVAERDSS